MDNNYTIISFIIYISLIIIKNSKKKKFKKKKNYIHTNTVFCNEKQRIIITHSSTYRSKNILNS
jgi:hypothetical protein